VLEKCFNREIASRHGASAPIAPSVITRRRVIVCNFLFESIADKQIMCDCVCLYNEGYGGEWVRERGDLDNRATF